MNKLDCKKELLRLWFYNRLVKISKDYRELCRGTNQANQLTYYKNQQFNILFLTKPSPEIFYVPDDSPYSKILDKFIRLKDHERYTSGYITKVLNFCESNAEIYYLLWFKKEYFDSIPTNRQDIVIAYEKENKSLFDYLKKIDLLRDL